MGTMSLVLSEELKQSIRMEAAKQRKSMNKPVVELVEEKLNKEKQVKRRKK